MKKALIVLLVALIAMTAVFASGTTETKAASNEPITITMLYAATATEVGPIPEDADGSCWRTRLIPSFSLMMA